MTPSPSPDTGDGLVKTLRKRASNHGKMLGNNGFYTASDAAIDIEAASRISALKEEMEGLKGDLEFLGVSQSPPYGDGERPAPTEANPSGPTFDPVVFGESLRWAMGGRGLSVRAAAKVIGISPATVSRVCNGKPPNIEGYTRISKWLGLDTASPDSLSTTQDAPNSFSIPSDRLDVETLSTVLFEATKLALETHGKFDTLQMAQAIRTFLLED